MSKSRIAGYWKFNKCLLVEKDCSDNTKHKSRIDESFLLTIVTDSI